ncbi:hypothetical protein N7540_012340 [Penicillium herquei]|nr:hypothetical protein N7540_012340 [Penicillium herquei]
MPQYNVTLKTDAPPEELEKAKQLATEKGGVITHEYSLIKGFMYVLYPSFDIIPLVEILTSSPSSVEYPEDHVDTLESSEHIHVEQDGEVKTQ